MFAMGLLLQILLYGTLAVVAVGLLTTLVLWRTLRRRLRVHPKTASIAPLQWNIPRGQAALAHRRLRTASQTALRITSNTTTGPAHAQPEFTLLAESIAQQSVSIERDLVQAARTHKVDRPKAFEQPINAITRLEATVAELAATSAQWQRSINGPPPPDPLIDVQDRLTALRQASHGVIAADAPLVLAQTPQPEPKEQRGVQMEG